MQKKHGNSYNPERYWDYTERTYGVTKDDWMQMFRDQGGRCAICLIEQHRVDQRFAVDHNHVTGKVRGLLCGSCNTAIGHLRDNVDHMKRAIAYLERETQVYNDRD